MIQNALEAAWAAGSGYIAYWVRDRSSYTPPRLWLRSWLLLACSTAIRPFSRSFMNADHSPYVVSICGHLPHHPPVHSWCSPGDMFSTVGGSVDGRVCVERGVDAQASVSCLCCSNLDFQILPPDTEEISTQIPATLLPKNLPHAHPCPHNSFPIWGSGNCDCNSCSRLKVGNGTMLTD